MPFTKGHTYGCRRLGVELLHSKPIAVRVNKQVRQAYDNRTPDEIRQALEEIAILKGWLQPETLKNSA